MIKRLAGLVSCVLLAAGAASARPLDIYFIDVEGGQATLVVSGDQSLLIDAGYGGRGARDAERILTAARDAHIDRIDYLLITHFHADHDGGVVELSQLLPIGTFIDHDTVPAAAEQNVAGTLAMFEAYAAVRAKGRHLVPRAGDRLPLKGVDAAVVSASGSTISRPLRGAGKKTAGCDAAATPAQEVHENPRSTGFRLRFGSFTFLDLGDLSGAPLFALACPASLVGPVDVYLVAHHGGVDAADAATFAAFAPRVAIVNNGANKGGAPNVFRALRQASELEDVWQLHRSQVNESENFADERIANLDETTAHWLKLTAKQDGSFTVTNGRSGATKAYAAHR
jgi:competence protein ComEC